jgi:nuclear pore complex protein Nup54
MAAFSFKPTFGATTTTTAASGGLFGNTTSTAAPVFGFGAGSAGTASTFGQTTGFGATPATPAFGSMAAVTSAPTGFGGFGTGLASATPAFGTSTTTTATPGFGGLGAFGTTVSNAGTTGFGTGTAFGGAGTTGFGGTTFGTGGFGSINTGSAFGPKAPTTGLTFGSGTNTGIFGVQTTTQAPAQTPLSSILTAVSVPVIFGDERDSVIAKWNQLQAFWGTGRGYFNQQGHYVDFAPDNPFSFFKAVGYNILPTMSNEDGLVALTIDRKMSEVCDSQQAIVDMLQRIVINNQQNATVCVEGIRPLVDDRTEMIIYVQQRANTGVMTRVTASDLFTHLNTIKQQLTTQLSVSAVLPKTGMTNEQKKLYLDNPPAGIDARIWDQAKLDNPDPARMIPVPMVGFSELHNRLKHQEQQTNLHQARLDLIANDIATLQRNQSDVVSKIEQYKRNQLMLGHRVLKVLVKQELYRKHGYAIQADEEQLRTKLEAIYAELSAPMQFKGRLNELMSQMRMQNQLGVVSRCDVSYQIEPSVQREIKQHLKRQQDGLSVLIDVIKDDLTELKVIEQGLADSSSKLRR